MPGGDHSATVHDNNLGIIATGAGARAEQHVHPPPVITPMEQVDPAPGVINLPGRSALFVGREQDMRRLRKAITSAALGSVVVTAVHGLGGVGKSTLAAHYAQAHRAEYSLVWWITADAPSAIETGVAQLAVAVQPAVAGLPLEQQTEHGLRWLATHQGWLLILDNLTAPTDAATQLARLPGGHVVITSRRTTGWHTLATPVLLDVLEPAEAVEMLTRILSHDRAASAGSAGDVAAVCAELGYLPLAIEQAGAYITETGTSPRAYRELLARYPAAMYQQTAEGGDAQRTMARIWRVTLDTLATTPLAGQVLRVLAWYAPKDIPTALLTGLAEQPALVTAIGRLAAYGMITYRDGVISVHRLVQAVTRTADPDDPHRTPAEVTTAREHATRILARILGSLDVEDPAQWPVLHVLLPHTAALIGHTLPAEDSIDTATVMISIGVFLYGQGSLTDALTYLHRCLAGCERILGPDHRTPWAPATTSPPPTGCPATWGGRSGCTRPRSPTANVFWAPTIR